MRATRHNVVTSQGINFSMENGHVCQGKAVWCAKLVCRAGSSMDRPLRREARRRFFCTDNSGLFLCTHTLNHLAKNTAKISCLAATCPPNGHRGGSWCVKLCQKTRVKTGTCAIAHGARKFFAQEDKIGIFRCTICHSSQARPRNGRDVHHTRQEKWRCLNLKRNLTSGQRAGTSSCGESRLDASFVRTQRINASGALQCKLDRTQSASCAAAKLVQNQPEVEIAVSM